MGFSYGDRIPLIAPYFVTNTVATTLSDSTQKGDDNKQTLYDGDDHTFHCRVREIT